MRVHHFSLEVQDLEQSVAFYERLLGFVPESRLLLDGERIAFLKLGAARLELVQPAALASASSQSEASASAAPTTGARLLQTHMAFEVDDLRAAIDPLLHAGCVLVEGPSLLANGWSNVFLDGLNGERLEFVELKKFDK
ncbi:hypothetical protein GZH47_25635 [Paenibacillus rhizovicinus]|uniref:VOC domain-containing protein n=1 Tax=Paenibacillus rhizovicinus TaxID=2704463 RepID=A0A6C0P884_9BACL|nr:VOC family protein [Paenibacillus rhizovicinus]QHW33843.1 hypothetical protein GZH47_25635 [Paenibacillus rhizovicinus]